MRLGAGPPDATPLREDAAGEATDQSTLTAIIGSGTTCARPTRSRACSRPSGTERCATHGALSQDTARLMVFKLVMTAARTWRRLKGENQLPKVVQGVTFRNGVEVTNTPDQSAA